MDANQTKRSSSVLKYLVKSCVIAPPVETNTEKYVELKNTNINSIFLRMNQVVVDNRNVEQTNIQS